MNTRVLEWYSLTHTLSDVFGLSKKQKASLDINLVTVIY